MCLRTHQKELDTQTNVAVLVRSIWLRTLYCTMGRFREPSASMQGPPPEELWTTIHTGKTDLSRNSQKSPESNTAADLGQHLNVSVSLCSSCPRNATSPWLHICQGCARLDAHALSDLPRRHINFTRSRSSCVQARISFLEHSTSSHSNLF